MVSFVVPRNDPFGPAGGGGGAWGRGPPLVLNSSKDALGVWARHTGRMPPSKAAHGMEWALAWVRGPLPHRSGTASGCSPTLVCPTLSPTSPPLPLPPTLSHISAPPNLSHSLPLTSHQSFPEIYAGETASQENAEKDPPPPRDTGATAGSLVRLPWGDTFARPRRHRGLNALTTHKHQHLQGGETPTIH